MERIITLEVLAALSQNGFSLDELVIKTKELFEREGLSGFVSLILRLVDEQLCIEFISGRRATLSPCCGHARHEHLDQLDRRFRTSIGMVSLRWRRLRCTNCGASFIPLREFLGLAKHQSKTSELERIVAEIVSEQSYRRSSSHLDTIGLIPVAKSTAHRWVAQSDCDMIDPCRDKLDLLFADGTCYKRRPDKHRKINNRGELRIGLGVTKSGSVVSLGAFSGVEWDQIASKIKDNGADDGPLAEMLVSDGEAGIVNNLGPLCDSSQRCHWHIVRDINHALYLDAVEKRQRDKMKKELAATIAIELPREDMDEVKYGDLLELSQRAVEAEKEIGRLVGRLREKKYTFAADYVSNASSHLFSYVYRWFETGIVSPRVSSFIERMMRELARRLKRMAFGWSENGAAKMARIIIKRFTSANKWQEYWNNKLRINDSVLLALRSIRAF